jgi:hypothetical protein
MGWDVGIAVLLSLFTWRMAYLGVHVSLHPPGSRAGRSKKSVKREFYVIAFLSTLLVFFQAYRTSQAYSGLVSAIQKNQSPTVGLSDLNWDPDSWQLVPDRDLRATIRIKVWEGTARGMKCYFDGFTMPGLPDEQNKLAISRFKKYMSDQQTEGDDKVKGAACFLQLSFKFDETQITDIVSTCGINLTNCHMPSKIIYVMAHAEWKNDSGADFHYDAYR